MFDESLIFHPIFVQILVMNFNVVAFQLMLFAVNCILLDWSSNWFLLGADNI